MTGPESGNDAYTGPPCGDAEGHVPVVGGRIHYIAWGPREAAPLVLLPKQGGWAAEWRHAAPHLAQHFHVIALDPPGYGDTEIAAPPPYISTIEESAAAIVAALDALGATRFHLAGSSLGGGIALCLAARWPEKVRSLIILGSALTPAFDREAIEARDAGGYYGPVDEQDRPLPSSPEHVRRMYHDLSHLEEINAARFCCGRWIKPSSRGAARADNDLYYGMIRCPALMLLGEHGLYKEFEAPFLAGVAGARSIHIPGAKSFAYQEAPRETAQIMTDFLDEVDQGAAMVRKVTE